MSHCRVLIVDDEEDFASALAVRLRHRGFTVDTAPDGNHALLAVKTHRPHVVLLDVSMPGLDGIEVLRRLHQQAPEVRVLLLSGHASVPAGIDGMRLGAFDYLIKPTDIDELCEKLQAACNQHARKSDLEP